MKWFFLVEVGILVISDCLFGCLDFSKGFAWLRSLVFYSKIYNII
ncbi:MAG: hypothetical protein Q4Q18_04440 [Methanobrevibacter sp.]|nr:hypothetical protein [Methanobrevibacter sp.]